MEDKKMKTTAPVPSVGADGEQPFLKNSEVSIADNSAKSNDEDLGLKEVMRQMRRITTRLFDA